MPESDSISSLPVHAVDKLRATTIELAQRLDALIAHLEDDAGYATLRIVIEAGSPKMLFVERSFVLS